MKHFPAIALLASLSACGNNQPAADTPSNATAAAAQPVLLPSQSAPTLGEERVGAFRFRVDTTKLAKVGTNISVPPDWKSYVLGFKLIAPERARMLDRGKCIYGASDTPVPCNADQEAGLSFALLNVPYAALKAQLPADQIEALHLAGVDGVRWSIGAEEEGAEYSLIPSDAGTLLIVNQYRETGNPDGMAIAEALGTLRRG